MKQNERLYEVCIFYLKTFKLVVYDFKYINHFNCHKELFNDDVV